MPDHLNLIDQSLFFAINHGLSNPFFDWLMPMLRNRFFWTPLYLFMAIFFVRNYGRQGWMILAFMGITFGIADYSSSSIIKPAVERLRPCNDPHLKADVNNLIACGSGYSFPSSHATNHFALALFLTGMFTSKWRMILFLAPFWAFLVSFAQIYVGVHYPGDILFGAILGGIIGKLTSTVLLHTQLFREWKSGNS